MSCELYSRSALVFKVQRFDLRRLNSIAGITIVMYEELLGAVVGEQSLSAGFGGAGLALLEWPRLAFLPPLLHLCCNRVDNLTK